MRKKILVLSVLIGLLLLSNVHASTYTTSAVGSKHGFTVTARALWDYTSGAYAGKGTHTVNKKPADTLFMIYGLEYVRTLNQGAYTTSQYFRGGYFHVLDKKTYYFSDLGITLNSSGPY